MFTNTSYCVKDQIFTWCVSVLRNVTRKDPSGCVPSTYANLPHHTPTRCVVRNSGTHDPVSHTFETPHLARCLRSTHPGYHPQNRRPREIENGTGVTHLYISRSSQNLQFNVVGQPTNLPIHQHFHHWVLVVHLNLEYHSYVS